MPQSQSKSKPQKPVLGRSGATSSVIGSRVNDLKKTSPDVNPDPSTFNVDSIIISPPSSTKADMINCCCCGTLLVLAGQGNKETNLKFKCSICNTTNLLCDIESDTKVPHLLSYEYVRRLADSCLKDCIESKSLHEIFRPLSSYLYSAFRNLICVNNSFKVNPASKHNHYSMSNINYIEIHKCFNLLLKLPTKKPLYRALCGSVELLKRVHVFTNNDDPRNLNWVLILFEIPFLYQSLIIEESSDLSLEIKELCYEVLKRAIGLLSNCITAKSLSYVSSWFSKLDKSAFIKKVDLLNHYITFHLKKHYHVASNPQLSKFRPVPNPPVRRNSMDDEYLDQVALKIQVNASVPLKSKSKASKPVKITIHQYGNDWHIKTAAHCLSMFIKANSIRDSKFSSHLFYNSLVDYVDVKLDFDSWQKNTKQHIRRNSHEPDLNSLIEYIHGNNRKLSLNEKASFYFCQFPFLISLGGKIAISEYEAKRQMERKAEEAFVNSLDKRVMIDIYFQVVVRRERVIQDSLLAIQSNSGNLKKTLRVKFVGEPGVDAGGLKKEWFLLLTRKMFNPNTGMFNNCEDSNLLWFSLKPLDNEGMYYLFGAVLGLAIYNSTILDLQFPRALYKILLGHRITIEDYEQLFPVSYKNLIKLRSLTSEELEYMELTFEVDFQDVLGRNHTRELIPQGKGIAVTKKNVDEYITKYYRFFMYDGIFGQLRALKLGFTNVIGGNGLSLYSGDEIELLLCGDNSQVDIETLKSVTRYFGWDSKDHAISSNIVKWFWEYLQQRSFSQQRKFLIFVTGSDRVPATGIQNMNFRISLAGKDCNRLPTAHTCFNELELYDYATKEKLVQKLNFAINEAAGFGIK